jgi:hypothetical protein
VQVVIIPNVNVVGDVWDRMDDWIILNTQLDWNSTLQFWNNLPALDIALYICEYDFDLGT